MLVGAWLVVYALLAGRKDLTVWSPASSLLAGTSTAAPPPVAPPSAPVSLRDRVTAILPTNIFQATAAGAVLPILLFTVFFGLAVTRLAPERRDPLQHVFQSLADAMLVLVGWILKALPSASSPSAWILPSAPERV
jgi:Na+/H+-dicarboxylate symporter